MLNLLLGAMASAALTRAAASSPIPVGTALHWDVSSDSAQPTYRFRYRKLGSDYQMIRDFSSATSLDWNAPLTEGAYELEMTARDATTGDVSSSTEMLQVTPRTGADGMPVVSPTAHPLVFLYSAAACGGGRRIRIEFTGSDGVAHRTPYQSCSSRETSNVYLAGLYADADYNAHQIVDTGSAFKQGPDVPFHTGSLPDGLFTEVPLQSPPDKVSNPVLLGTSSSNGSVATGLDGRAIWYLPAGPVSFIARPESGGYFWGYLEDFSAGPSGNFIRKLDLAGSIVLETNAARVSEQLAARGKRAISGFHHEVRTLPDGRIVALATVEQMMTGVQGPGPIDILGDMIIVFDRDLNVVWTWDAFDNLDVTRKAVLGETCAASGACSPHFLAADGNDWTHGNAVQQTPDGNFLYSSRHQDWLIKISYDNGEGDGHIIWRMGKGGDFAPLSSDAYPWFSHQHDGNFLLSDPGTLLVYDDGNTRVSELHEGHSRGQVFQVDESRFTVTPVVNADLGVYSLAVGSAQRLRNGDFAFDSGFVPEDNSVVSYSAQVNAAGNIVYQAKANAILYRTFRMADMYSPN